jgi:hypothetical protein
MEEQDSCQSQTQLAQDWLAYQARDDCRSLGRTDHGPAWPIPNTLAYIEIKILIKPFDSGFWSTACIVIQNRSVATGWMLALHEMRRL